MEITEALFPLWIVNVSGTLLAKVNAVIRMQPAAPSIYSPSGVAHFCICSTFEGGAEILVHVSNGRDFTSGISTCCRSRLNLKTVALSEDVQVDQVNSAVASSPSHIKQTRHVSARRSPQLRRTRRRQRLSCWLMARGGGPMLGLWWGNLYSSARKQWQFILLQCVSRETSARLLLRTVRSLAQ